MLILFVISSFLRLKAQGLSVFIPVWQSNLGCAELGVCAGAAATLKLCVLACFLENKWILVKP